MQPLATGPLYGDPEDHREHSLASLLLSKFKRPQIQPLSILRSFFTPAMYVHFQCLPKSSQLFLISFGVFSPQSELKKAMSIIQETFRTSDQKHPFKDQALSIRMMPKTYSDQYKSRLDQLGRVVRLPGVPTTTPLSDVVRQGALLFQQPPLSANIPMDTPLKLLGAANRGQPYNSYNLPERSRWMVYEAVGTLGDGLFKLGPLNHNRLHISGDLDGAYVLHVGK